MDTLYSDVFDGSPGRVLSSRGAEKILRRRLLPLVDGINGALRVRKALGLSWGDLARSAFGKNPLTNLTLAHQIRLANSFQRVEQSVYQGDTEHGFIFSGQSQGGIKDIPTVAELINRIVAEADNILSNAREKYHII